MTTTNIVQSNSKISLLQIGKQSLLIALGMIPVSYVLAIISDIFLPFFTAIVFTILSVGVVCLLAGGVMVVCDTTWNKSEAAQRTLPMIIFSFLFIAGMVGAGAFSSHTIAVGLVDLVRGIPAFIMGLPVMLKGLCEFVQYFLWHAFNG